MQSLTKREGQDRHLVDHRQLGADPRGWGRGLVPNRKFSGI